MATWPEARAKKAERVRREQRYYTPDKRGPRCQVCGEWTAPIGGYPVHPTCAEPEIMEAGRTGRRPKGIPPARQDPPSYDENGHRLKHTPLRELVEDYREDPAAHTLHETEESKS